MLGSGAGTVSNIAGYRQQSAGKSDAPNIGKKAGCAECSRDGEDNSVHIAIAIVAVGVLAVVAGMLNAKVSVGKG